MIRTKAGRRAKKTVRLEARVSAEVKKAVRRAAAIRGDSTTAFIVSTLKKEAQKVLDESKRVDLDYEHSKAFVQALLNPSKPNKKLRSAFALYHKQVETKQ